MLRTHQITFFESRIGRSIIGRDKNERERSMHNNRQFDEYFTCESLMNTSHANFPLHTTPIANQFCHGNRKLTGLRSQENKHPLSKSMKAEMLPKKYINCYYYSVSFSNTHESLIKVQSQGTVFNVDNKERTFVYWTSINFTVNDTRVSTSCCCHTRRVCQFARHDILFLEYRVHYRVVHQSSF